MVDSARRIKAAARWREIFSEVETGQRIQDAPWHRHGNQLWQWRNCFRKEEKGGREGWGGAAPVWPIVAVASRLPAHAVQKSPRASSSKFLNESTPDVASSDPANRLKPANERWSPPACLLRLSAAMRVPSILLSILDGVLSQAQGHSPEVLPILEERDARGPPSD